jgi:hypothetical protein
VLERLGPKRAEEGAYVWQKLMKTGAIVSNGTDAPVEDVDPISNYYATVSRKTKTGQVFYGDQRMSRLEALKSYTLNPAYAAFEESSKGSLKVGKLADMTVLSKDITAIAEEEILSAQVSLTIVGGKVLYKREAAPAARASGRLASRSAGPTFAKAPVGNLRGQRREGWREAPRSGVRERERGVPAFAKATARSRHSAHPFRARGGGGPRAVRNADSTP